MTPEEEKIVEDLKALLKLIPGLDELESKCTCRDDMKSRPICPVCDKEEFDKQQDELKEYKTGYGIHTFCKSLQEVTDFLESLKRSHYYCEDSWYSCPLAPEGCADKDWPEACNCGANIHNERIDEFIKEL